MACNAVVPKSVMNFNCRLVFPAAAGTVIIPNRSAPYWNPKPPVNMPYPDEFWNTSLGRRPTMWRQRATALAHSSRSFWVWMMTVGLPVVPLDECKRTALSKETEAIPNGYVSRKSCLVVKGIFRRSSNDWMSSGVSPFSSNRFL